MADLPQRAKASVGTPLTPGAQLNAARLARLRDLSVTTVEELLGLIEAEPQLTAAYLEIDDLERLRASAAAGTVRATVVLGATPGRRPTGARLPSGASSTAELVPAVEPPPTGAVDLRPRFGPVRDQGRRGTCVALAVGALVESLEGPGYDVSEQFLYWAAKRHDEAPTTEGTVIKYAFEALEGEGVCPEAAWAYVPEPIAGNEGQGPPPPAAVAEASLHRKHGELVQPMPSVLCAHLDAGSPVAVCIPVFENWYGNPAVELLGLIPMPIPGSTSNTGHAMCAVGYAADDDFPGGGYFILRNSWGAGWASQSPIAPGYGLLPMAFVELHAYEAGVASAGVNAANDADPRLRGRRE